MKRREEEAAAKPHRYWKHRHENIFDYNRIKVDLYAAREMQVTPMASIWKLSANQEKWWAQGQWGPTPCQRYSSTE